MLDDLLRTQKLHPAPSKAAVAEQAEEMLRFASAHPDAVSGPWSLRIAGRKLRGRYHDLVVMENQSPEKELSP